MELLVSLILQKKNIKASENTFEEEDKPCISHQIAYNISPNALVKETR
jgi:hypothetical protein